MKLTRVLILIGSVFTMVVGCPGEDADDAGDGGTSSGTDTGGCALGTEGCGCRDATPACDPLLVCQADMCVIDTETNSSTGPTTGVSASETTADTGGTDAATTTGADGSSGGTDTGGQACTDSTDCPRGEVCTAPAESPGVPSGPFTCSTTCAGLGVDSPVCTDDASCCGAFCSDGSCLAP